MKGGADTGRYVTAWKLVRRVSEELSRDEEAGLLWFRSGGKKRNEDSHFLAEQARKNDGTLRKKKDPFPPPSGERKVW